MKKVIFISICLFSFYTNCNSGIIVANKHNTTMIYQSNDDWEKLGGITAISEYGSKESFVLYVKNIGLRQYYQVRKYWGVNSYSSHSVSLGKFTVKGKEYNAQFSHFDTAYYFNI